MASMSKKHFEAIAKIVAGQTRLNNLEQGDLAKGMHLGTRELAGHLASYFATENPLFERHRFLAACGLEA